MPRKEEELVSLWYLRGKKKEKEKSFSSTEDTFSYNILKSQMIIG